MAGSRENTAQGLFFLPGGYLSNDGAVHNTVKLRRLTGREEEMILAAGYPNDVIISSPDSADNQHRNITTLLVNILASCVERIGPITDITPDIIRNLLISDKDYLLLRLRQISLGNRVDARLRCPNEPCSKLLDIDFDLRTIEITRKPISQEIYTFKLSKLAAHIDKNDSAKRHTRVDFRLPKTVDQEELSDGDGNSLFVRNESKALTRLLQRCLVRIGDVDEIDEDIILSLPILARREVQAKMQEYSPRVDLAVTVACPECKTKFTSPFDLEDFFLGN